MKRRDFIRNLGIGTSDGRDPDSDRSVRLRGGISHEATGEKSWSAAQIMLQHDLEQNDQHDHQRRPSGSPETRKAAEKPVEIK